MIAEKCELFFSFLFTVRLTLHIKEVDRDLSQLPHNFLGLEIVVWLASIWKLKKIPWQHWNSLTAETS